MKIILSSRVILPKEVDISNQDITNRREIINIIATSKQNKLVGWFYIFYISLLLILSSIVTGTWIYFLTIPESNINEILFITSLCFLLPILPNWYIMNFGSGNPFMKSEGCLRRKLWTIQPSSTYILARYCNMDNEQVDKFFNKLLYCKYHVKYSDKLEFTNSPINKKCSFNILYNFLLWFNIIVKALCVVAVLIVVITFIYWAFNN